MEANQNLQTKYAPVLRALKSKLLTDFKTIESLDYIQEILNSYPHVCAILNKQRQVVFSNDHLIKIAGFQNIEQIIGSRPGEIIMCINSQTEDGGCGTSEACSLCNIVNTILETQISHKRITKEASITAQVDNKLIYYDFQVTCSPIYFNNEMYVMMILVDINHEKKNKLLENIFFHDILNRAGSLHGLTEVLKRRNQQEDMKDYIEVLSAVCELMTDDIKTQRNLNAAENSQLILNVTKSKSSEIIESVCKQFSFHPVAHSYNNVIIKKYSDFEITTDVSILKRILLNMLKNAVEAGHREEQITIYCEEDGTNAHFSVHNNYEIPKEIQMQIFQRSFSTKGEGRGLGTYSMKIFGENYLQGKVTFTTGSEGTVFSIKLPLTYLKQN